MFSLDHGFGYVSGFVSFRGGLSVILIYGFIVAECLIWELREFLFQIIMMALPMNVLVFAVVCPPSRIVVWTWQFMASWLWCRFVCLRLF